VSVGWNGSVDTRLAVVAVWRDAHRKRNGIFSEDWIFLLCGSRSFSSVDLSSPRDIKRMAEKEGFNEVLIEPLKQFAKDSLHLVKKCTKPDRKEFTAIAKATGVGFLIMGFIGFFVKLIHIPINNILVGS